MFKKIDRSLVLVVLLLTVFGLVMMSSISIPVSYANKETNNFYFLRHFYYILLGLIGGGVIISFPLEKLKKLALPLLMLSLLLLMATFFKGESHGTTATLWLQFKGRSFQPVEFFKLTFIIFLSAFLASGKINPARIENGLIPFLLILLLPIGIVMTQSDYGALFIIMGFSLIMYFVAGANLKHISSLLGGGGIIAMIGILSNEYIQKRFEIFLNPELDPLGSGYQVKQALIAIGSGGLWGRGFQNSIQKYNYLPEAHTDTIFAAISEEMGFFMMIIFLLAYLFVGFKGFKIAQRIKEPFFKFLCIGISSWFLLQAFTNVAVNVALFPNTGITLPLISYGGTSLIFSLASLAILINLSQHQSEKKRYHRFSL